MSLINVKYELAHNEMRALMPEVPKELRDITPEDVKPYGIFIPHIPLLYPPHADEDKWTVMTEGWFVACDGTVVHFQVGDKTDLASIGRIVKLLFRFPGRETPAAVGHDEGYSQAGKKRYNIFEKVLWLPPQSWWDEKVFKNGMLLCKTSRIKVCVYYRALRMFGWIAWNHYRRKAKM